jgi:predicted DCC family thiol-disulfide oxidoreductase YuxK
MKTNAKILLYDDYCPLCTWYSGLFVKYNLLNAENRVPFSKADVEILSSIDIEKAKDEIPLFDVQTQTTVYGIDALLEILSQKNAAIKSIGNFKPVKWFLKKLYKFISYNRKVIVAKKCSRGNFDCSPGFNVFYRVLFMVLFFFFNSIMLFPLHANLFHQFSFYHLSFNQLQQAHLTFVTINCIIASSLKQKQGIEYLGQVNMLALITILLLIPAMITSNLLTGIEWIIVSYFIFLTTFIIKEYLRRMKYANIFLRHKSIIAINLFCLAAFLVYVFH